MSLVESNAAFVQRCGEIDPSGNLSTALAGQNVTSFSGMAFSVCTPQTAPTDQQFDTLARAVFGAAATLGQTGMLRRLHFESTTLMIASVKQRVDSEAADKADSVKRIPIAEKKHRLEMQSDRLVGVEISGELVNPVENQQLRIAQVPDEFKADCGSEIKLQWCWQRRGIAMDQCKLVSWSVHQSWVQQLFQTMSHSPPPGYQHVSMQQMIRADRELWTLLSKECKGSLKPDNQGNIPLDAKITALSKDPRITMFLLPLPSSVKTNDKESPTKRTTATGSTQAAAKNAANKKRRTRADKGCPDELKKFQLRCEHGPVCWAYNLKSGGKRKRVSQEAEVESDQPQQKAGRRSDAEVLDTCPTSPEFPPFAATSPKGDVESAFAAAQRKKFMGKLVNDLIFVEICAGSARLTRAARDAGFNGLAIDHTNRRSCGIDICIFELEDQTQVDDLCNFLEEQADNIAAVWIAPSCGTASKARERRLPQLQRLGIDDPIPLRSILNPDQIDGLDGTNKLKVEKANLLYDAVEQILRTTCKAHIFTGVENPANSHFWGTSPMQRIQDEFGQKFVTFHNCCHGGSRDKLTSLWVNESWLDSLEARCDKSHPHKSWAVKVTRNSVSFPTADEAAYPLVLCQRIIDCVMHQVKFFGTISSSSLEQQITQPDADSAGRIALGALPRGAKVKPLVAEYGRFLAVVAPTQRTETVDQFLSTLPKGSKVTSRHLWKRGTLRVENGPYKFLAGAESVEQNEMVELCWIGIPSEPDEFVARAFCAGHPRSLDVHVDEAMQDVVKLNLIDPPFILAKRRVQFIKKWTNRAAELKDEEAKLRETMPDHVRQVLGNKRLVLMREMLESLQYPDKKLVDDIAAGFKLSGYMTKSNVFRSKSKRPAMSLCTLKKLSKSFNARSAAALGGRQDAELEVQTWKETEAELDKGWVFLGGTDNLDGKFLGKRFGLKQGQKTRVIDDCTCCGLNLTVGLHEKLRLHSVDFLAAIFGYAFKACKATDRPSVRGRTYDLKSAYKQYAIHPDDRASLRMGVNVPGQDKFAVIGFNSLPFGAVGSVAGFLRISQAVRYLGYFGLGLLWSAFYDDYTLLSRSELESSSSWACEMLFDLLGLHYAKEGHKCVPFSEKFKTLGLEVDTSNFRNGSVLVGHTDSRKEELADHINSILKCGKLATKEAERLRGRMIFFEGYTFGRVANSSVKALGRFCTGPSVERPLDDDMTRALRFLGARVVEGKPLKIERALHTTWLVFTDGACDPEAGTGSVGGMIYDPNGQCLRFFGEAVPPEIMKDLLSRSKNPIHELEILPVFIAADLWGDMYPHAQVVYYIDNESSRMAHIKGTGETLRASMIIEQFVKIEFDAQHRVWFGRVPSYSNPADSPSRLDFTQALRLGATRTSVNWEKAEAVKNIPPTSIEVDDSAQKLLPVHPSMSNQAGSAPLAGQMMPPPAAAAASWLASPPFDVEDVPIAPMDGEEPASKKARMCMIAGVEYEHEDDHNYTTFTNDELDSLEEFDFGMCADDVEEEFSAEDWLVQQLVFPCSNQEPQLPLDQLLKLDAMAMEVGTLRLKKMGALLPPETVGGLNPKHLSTRYVITWREKVQRHMHLDAYCVLPGQRDGSQLCFESATKFLNEMLGFKHCDAYPSLLSSPDGECLILLHVDDMLVVTEQEYFDGKLVPTLTSKYKTSVHCMSQPGDAFEFLKRIHVLVDDQTIHIQQNPRHFDKLFEVVGIQCTMNPKKVPCHELMCEVDDTPALGPDKATRYRSAVGILLYLASDLVECAFTIRGLAQYMCTPTERSRMMLKHLCLYPLSVRNQSLQTQRIVALSSAEAEIHAAVSTTCDGLLLRVCVEFCTGEKVNLKITLDNTAAKQVMQRSGVGRIRHLSCRVLWVQQLVKNKELYTSSIPTKENFADLGTKKLSRDRMQYLMHGVGVFNEDSGELVGSDIVG
eukprot:s469_g16.t1